MEMYVIGWTCNKYGKYVNISESTIYDNYMKI
jgi:hypothetical protein